MEKETKVAVQEETAVSTDVGTPMGFEDEEAGDMVIPRIKVINALSPERKDKKADEGDVINSLTLEKLNGRVFIPVFKFNNNILWKDRADGGGIACIARDGKMGSLQDGSALLCATCRKCEFDNSKTGKDAAPKCTKYINFFGFITGTKMPIILSFSKTSFAEGKRMYSLAKVTMQNMWNFGYRLDAKLMSKGGNEWYNPAVEAAGPTDEADRAFASELYKNFRTDLFKYDMEEAPTSGSSVSTEDVEKSEF